MSKGPPPVSETPQENPAPAIPSDVTASTSSSPDIAINVQKKKTLCEAYILSVPPLGLLGGHNFYLGRPGFGVLYIFTIGLFGVGWLTDLFRMPLLVQRANAELEVPHYRRHKKLDDAYVCWFPGGLFGIHHFYLGRTIWGIVYLFSLGLLGIGFLIDGIRMKQLVDAANEDIDTLSNARYHKKKLHDLYIVTIFPFTGWLGVQHYMLRRYGMGLFYTFTLGNFGLGWIMDWFRMPCLVNKYNKDVMNGVNDDGKKKLDDAYLFLFPFGWLGLHHFYLGRYCWGLLYLFTIGCFGIGWLCDFVRLPFLVNDYNKAVDERQRLVIAQQSQIQGISGPGSQTQPSQPQAPQTLAVNPKTMEAGVYDNGPEPWTVVAYPPQNAPLPGYTMPMAPAYEDTGHTASNSSNPASSNVIAPEEFQQPPSYQDVLQEEDNQAANYHNEFKEKQ